MDLWYCFWEPLQGVDFWMQEGQQTIYLDQQRPEVAFGFQNPVSSPLPQSSFGLNTFLTVCDYKDHVFLWLHDNAGNTFLGCNEGAARADSRIIPSRCPSPFLSPVPPMLTQCLGKHPNIKFGHFLTKRERENTQYVWSIFPPDWTNRNVLTNILYRPENKPFLCSFWIQGVNYTITNM